MSIFHEFQCDRILQPMILKTFFFFGCQNVYILNNDEYPDLSQHGMLMAAYKHGQEYTDYILYVAFVSTVDTKFIYMYIGDETCP